MKSPSVETATDDDPYDGLPPDVFETIVDAFVNALVAEIACTTAQAYDTVELHGKKASGHKTTSREDPRADDGHDGCSRHDHPREAEGHRGQGAHGVNRIGARRRGRVA